MELKAEKFEQIKFALLKTPATRSYDDLLLLKYYLSRTEFIQKTLAGVANPRQMNDLCRNLGLEVYEKDGIVFSQGDPGDKVYVLLAGSCEVRVKYKIDLIQGKNEMREKVVLTYDKSGQFFGERALQFDEPRSAGVVCTSLTHLITITKVNYLQVVNETRNELPLGLKMEQYGTKEGVVKILSKVREKRSNQELDAVAAYLYRRVPFFQKFTMQHVVELCRVAETVTIWGRSVLFKQGQIGQAFYVILSGTVEVWVNDSGVVGGTTTAYVPRHNRAMDVTDGLGSRVNQLVTGDCFGERALENDDSMRMASIVTGEDTTELLVLTREDYNNLVFLTMQGDSAHKLKLLRKTELFRTLDSVHLQALSKFMEPRKYQIDEELVTAGKRASEMIIIETGECKAITEVTEGFEKLTEEEKQNMAFNRLTEKNSAGVAIQLADNNSVNSPKIQLDDNKSQGTKLNNNSSNSNKSDVKEVDVLSLSVKELRHNLEQQAAERNMIGRKIISNSGDGLSSSQSPKPMKLQRRATQNLTAIKKKVISLGRIAPNSVLASYLALLNDAHDDVYHSETVIAASLVTAYIVSKHDLITHLAKDSFLAINRAVQDQKKPVLNFLWENVPRMLDENQWRMEKTWERFRTQMAQDQNKNVNILNTLKQLNRMHISQSSGNDHSMRIVTTTKRNGEDSYLSNISKTIVTKDWGLPGSMTLHTERANMTESLKAISVSANSLAASSTNNNKSLNNVSWASYNSNSNAQVSTLIRQRLNESHTTTKQLELSSSTMLRKSSVDLASSFGLRAKTPHSDDLPSSPLNNSLRPNNKVDTNLDQMPFCLVQIHREFTRADPVGMIEHGRRHLRSYMRIGGSFHTCAKAKEIADMQMEQVYLSLFHSEPSKEKELLLQWKPFRGFEGMPVNDSDIFIVYCRSAPLEFASINPTKNIFNMNYPAICKPQHQRFAVIVTNRLKDEEEENLNRKVSTSNSNDSNNSNSDVDNDDEVEQQQQQAIPPRPLLRRDSTHNSILSQATDDDYSLQTDKDNNNNNKQHGRRQTSWRTTNTADRVNSKNRRLGSSSTDNLSSNLESTSKFESSMMFGKNLSNANVTVPLSNTKIRQWPQYLLECSVLYEVLMTTKSRLDGLKYAVKRFGAMSDENDKTNHLDSSRLDSRRKARGHLFENDSKVLTWIGTGFTKRIYLKAYNNKHPDRVLRVAIQEKKLICVVPLFKWILINLETFQTLDFTRAFSESNIHKIFYAESMPQRNNRLDDDDNNNDDDLDEDMVFEDDDELSRDHQNISNYRDLNVEFRQKQYDPTMIKAFSEVGLLGSYNAKLSSNSPGLPMMNSESSPSFPFHQHGEEDSDYGSMTSSNVLIKNYNNKPESFSTEQLIHTQALQLFEREITSKEISKQINGSQTLWVGNNFPFTNGEDGQVGGNPDDQQATSSSSYPANDSSLQQQENHVTRRSLKPPSDYRGIVEQKLQILNDTLTQRSQVIQEHDRLYDQEHDTKLSTIKQQPNNHHHNNRRKHSEHDEEDGPGNNGNSNSNSNSRVRKVVNKVRRTREEEMGLLQRRLEVIENLQQVGNYSLLGEDKSPFAQLLASKKSSKLQSGGSKGEEEDNFKSVQNIVYGGRPTTPVGGNGGDGSPTASSKHPGTGRKKQIAGSTGPVGSAGKRLAENLRVLAETLDQQNLNSMSSPVK